MARALLTPDQRRAAAWKAARITVLVALALALGVILTTCAAPAAAS